MSQSAPSRIYYGWIVVAITALTLLIVAGVRSAPGVFLVPLQQDTGWHTSEISFAVAIGLVMLGASGPLSGNLVNNLGPRRIMLIGLLLIVVSMGLSYYIRATWQLDLLWGVISGVGTGIISSILGPTVANRWFLTRRSFVVGIFGASTSAGQLIFFPALIGLVGILGWRMSSVLLAVISAANILPVLIFLRDQPADMGLRPYGAVGDLPPSATAIDRSVMQKAIRSSEFWLLAITFFVCGATSNGLIGTHFIKHAGEHGVTPGVAAGLMSLMGAMNFVGTLASGWLTDKYDPRKLLCAYYGFRGLSLLFLPFVTTTFGLSVFAVLFGLDYIATVPPTTALVADKFGRKNVGVVYGWVFCSHQIGAAMATWLGGIARDTFGNYGLAFLVAGVIAVLAGLLALRINRQSALEAVAAAA